MPGANELIYHASLGYYPTKSPFDRITYIWPVENHVTLGFFYGGNLNDQNHLLEGEGKRMRHVKVRSVQEEENPALKSLLKEAWANAPGELARIQAAKKEGDRKVL